MTTLVSRTDATEGGRGALQREQREREGAERREPDEDRRPSQLGP